MNFVTTDDLGLILKRTIALDDKLALLALETACEAVRNYLDQRIDLADQTVRVDGSGTDALLLEERPARVVTSVTVDGEIVTDWWMGAHSILYREYPWTWPLGRGNTYVTYSSGWSLETDSGSGAVEGVPAPIRMAALLAARRIFTSRSASIKVSEQIGSYAYTDKAGADPGDLADGERRLLDHYVARRLA